MTRVVRKRDGNKSGMCLSIILCPISINLPPERRQHASCASMQCSTPALGTRAWVRVCILGLPGALGRQSSRCWMRGENQSCSQSAGHLLKWKESTSDAKPRACVSSHSVLQEQKLGHVQPNVWSTILTLCVFSFSAGKHFPLSS